MANIQANPFLRANPFHPPTYQKFQHPHALTNRVDLNHLLYKDNSRPPPTSVLQNNWTFGENNLTKRVNFKKQDLSSSYVSQFEMKIKMSNVGVPIKKSQKPRITDSRLQNPFYRKNLLINTDEVLNQVEMDVSLYRNKATSLYENPTHPSLTKNLSFGGNTSQNYQETPTQKGNNSNEDHRRSFGPDNTPVSQYVQDSSKNNSLQYSRTPEQTARMVQQAQKANQDLPKTIKLKGRQFYLYPLK